MNTLDDLAPALPPAPTTDAAPAEAGIGHNRPPEPLPYDPEVHAAMVKKVEAFTDAAGQWLDLKTIETTEQAERLSDFVAGSRKVRKAIEDARAAAKKPWQEKADAAYAAFNVMVLKMNKTLDALNPLATDWLKRENARIAEEKRIAAEQAAEKRAEAERLAEIARNNNDVAGQVEAEQALKVAAKEEKAAAKPVSAKIGSATGAGRSMALRVLKMVRVKDINNLFRHYRDRPEVVEVLTRLAQADVRAAAWDGTPPPGTEVYESEGAA